MEKTEAIKTGGTGMPEAAFAQKRKEMRKETEPMSREQTLIIIEDLFDAAREKRRDAEGS